MSSATSNETRASLYEVAGGEPAFLALASAMNERCLNDPVLNHPFSHEAHPQHLERLGWYLGEVFGGPPTYSSLGGHSAMLLLHARTGAEEEMATRFVACFDLALDDAGLPDDEEFRQVLHDYMTWAVAEVHAYSPLDAVVPSDAAFPHWSWDGLQS